MPFAQTIDEEIRNLQNIATELAERPDLQHWATSNPDIANHVGDIHKLYPWLPPGVTLALGTARYAPDDPFVKQLSDQVMALGRKTQQWGGATSDKMAQAIDKGVLGTEIPGVTPSPHRGLLDTVAEDVGGAVGAVGRTVGGGIPEPVRTGVKTASRFTFAGLQSGLEGVSAGVRNTIALHQAVPASSPETYGLMHNTLGPSVPHFVPKGTEINTSFGAPVLPQLTVMQMINGRDSGSGFFPSGQASSAAHAAQLRAGSITGSDGTPHALTVGRALAGSVLPANSNAYSIVSGLADAGVALYADPAYKALAGVGELRAARAGIAEAGTHWGAAGGMFDQFRQTIGIKTAAEQLDSKVGQGIIAKLAEMGDFRDVHRFLGKKVDPMLSAELTAAHTPNEVRAILDANLGTGIEQLPTFHPRIQAFTEGKATDDFGNPIDKGLGNLGYTVDRTTRNWRPLAMLPGGEFPTDLSQFWTRREAVTQMESFLVNAKVDDSMISHVMEKVAVSTNRNQLYDAFHTGMDAVADNLTREFGIPTQQAKKMTRAWTTGGEIKDTTQYFRTSLEDKYVVPGVMVDGEPMIFDGPHLPTEHLQNSIKFPDFREIRRAASDYRKVVRALPGGKGMLHGVDIGTSALDAFMHVWKGAQLVRPALGVRIFGESQLAMAAAGDASAARHPMDWIGYVTGRKGATDVLGHEFTPGDYNHVFKGGAHSVLGFDPERVWSSQWTHIIRGDPGFNAAWAQEVRHMHIDPLARATASAMIGDGSLRDVQELKDAFFAGHLRQLRVDMIEPGKTWRAELAKRSVSDAYIDMTVERVRNLAREDPEVLHAIANGDFRGEQLAQMKDGKQLVGRAKYDRPPQALHDHLAELDTQGNAPKLVKGYLYGSTKIGPGATIAGLRDRAVTRAFNMLVGERIQTLAASPVFRQEYFKELDRLLPYMAPEEAARAVAAADKAGIGGLNAARAAGSLDAKTVDTIAKSRSLDTMSSLLHDLGHRSQASDMLRFVAPFGDAWKKILTRWVKLVGQNPATVERFRQGMTEAHQSGFVHTDPQSGQQVFTIPFTAQLDQAITGLPFPQTAPLNGLSVVGSGLPGVGPAVSVPMGLLAPHVPAAQKVMDTLVPFGAPNVKQGLLEAFLPGWAQRFRTASSFASPDQQSVFNHSVDQVLRYLVSNGADVSTPAGIAKTVAEARHKATLLYIVRGALQATSPSPPSVEYMVKDKGGKLAVTYQLTNELQNLYAGKGVDGKGKNDPQLASQIFLKLHGESNYLALQAFSTPRRYGLPTTQGAADWLVNHQGFRKTYPDVYGLLTPQKGAFDYSLYLGQLHTGERADRSSADFIRLANSRIASMIYDTQRNKLPDNASSADKGNYLGQLREWLKEKYPGYQAADLQVSKASYPDAIAQLTKAADDPAVRSTEAARGVRAYLQVRQQVIDFEKQNGSSVHTNSLSTSHAFDAQHLWLTQQATRLISEFPTLFPAWDNLLSHEVTLAPTPPAGG